MKIKNSIEWNNIESKLFDQSRNLKYMVEVRGMIRNISRRITELSREEVEARNRRSNRVDYLLSTINEEIEMVEEYILVAALLG